MKKTKRELEKYLPEEIYGVFRCSECGSLFEERIGGFIIYHRSYGTVSVEVVFGGKPVCRKCLREKYG